MSDPAHLFLAHYHYAIQGEVRESSSDPLYGDPTITLSNDTTTVVLHLDRPTLEALNRVVGGLTRDEKAAYVFTEKHVSHQRSKPSVERDRIRYADALALLKQGNP